MADPAYFTHHYGVIDDAQDNGEETSGTMPFRLWPAQVVTLHRFCLNRLVLILKARQLGISWLCCAYALWLCLFQKRRVVLCFSRGDKEAKELIRRIKALYDRLPEWMREGCPAMTKDNTSVLEWANGSTVQSFPATKDAGSGYTASLVIMDEFAKVMWARDLYTAVKPTIDGGGQLIVLSTAKGIGGQFHLLWTRAVAGLNEFCAIFLPWWSRPGRTQAWYRAKVAEASDPDLVKQEYPATAREAFVASGRTRFAPKWIERQEPEIREALAVSALPEALQAIAHVANLRVYKLPAVGRRYVLGADVAEGKEAEEGKREGDFSCGVLVDEETWEEVASLHGHWEPDTFGVYLHTLRDVYSKINQYACRIAVERNNHGHAVLTTLKLRECEGVMRGLDGEPGWHTNVQTKPQMIDLLAKGLRDFLIRVRTPAALDEMQIYEIKKDGKTGAPKGYHDDWVMAWAVALMACQTRTKEAVWEFT